MSPGERQILRDAIRAVRTHNEHCWWQLKREVFDFGLQDYYPAESMFERPAAVAMSAMSPSKIAALCELRQSLGLAQPENPIEHYSRAIVHEIVARARIAAYRTENW